LLRGIKPANQEWQMNKEHAKGAVDKAKGAVKETVGKVTGMSAFARKARLTRSKASCIRPLAM
jgi:hypothetical protein